MKTFLLHCTAHIDAPRTGDNPRRSFFLPIGSRLYPILSSQILGFSPTQCDQYIQINHVHTYTQSCMIQSSIIQSSIHHHPQPILGGTYFPPDDQPGRMGFRSILARVHEVWAARPDDVRAAGRSAVQGLREMAGGEPAGEAGPVRRDPCGIVTCVVRIHLLLRSSEPPRRDATTAPPMAPPGIRGARLRLYGRGLDGALHGGPGAAI